MIAENGEREQLLVDIARMYYFENLSQQQIANVLHMSRSNISLLLKACLEKNVIEIRINDSVSRAHEIAAQIKQKYGLRAVLIAKTFPDQEECQASVARLAAHHLRTQLSNNMLFGFTNEPIMGKLADMIYFSEFSSIHSVQLMGGLYAELREVEGQSLAKSFQKRLGGKAYLLHAPLILKSSALKNLLLMEPLIQETMSQYKKLDVATVYIEKPQLRYGALNEEEPYGLSKTDLLQLSELGAVCKFCGHYLDKDGKACNAGLLERSMGISLQELQRIPNVVGIAANVSNAPAVLSCLKGGYIDTLIIDEALAKSIV